MLARLRNMKAEFKDIKQADEDFDGDTAIEVQLKQMIAKVESDIKLFDKEITGHDKFLSQRLEKYLQADFLVDSWKILIEVREFKLRIRDTNLKLNTFEKMANELNVVLIEQDMKNALKILDRKAIKLRDRLLACRN